MAKSKSPKLRTVNKSLPPFPLNKFPKDFPYRLGRELIYLLASKGKPVLEGSDWESIFAECIGADWKPSNVGLDDVLLGNTAWGAKTVKSTSPSTQKKIRLISGRNSPVYSYGDKIDTDRKSTRLNSSHAKISYAFFCLKKSCPSPLASCFSLHVAQSHPTPHVFGTE